MECASLKNWHFCWNRRKKYLDLSRMVATQVTDILFGLAFWGNY